MKKLISIILCTSIMASCSFKSEDNGDGSGGAVESSTQSLKTLDTDGDMINDYDENQRGLDLNIANIPELKVEFLQNYNIQVEFEDNELFSIDTLVGRNNPNFKYKVGNLYLRENSLDNAAKLGKFSGVSWGTIKQQELSWMKYPSIDKQFYHNKVQEFELHKNKKIKTTKMNLENSFELKNDGVYDRIENLEVNFYYFSHSKGKHQLIHSETIEKVFQAGVRENFEVSIVNPDSELLNDSYLRHGEFVISEVKDFYIPQLKVKYSTLLKSVKNSTLPVYITTPFKNDVKFVAVKASGEGFVSIMNKVFGENYKIENEILTQVEQFRSNLDEFNYLNELSGMDKNGKWFVMTNEIKNHYLKHKYKKSDLISLSYMIGDDLSKRVQDKYFLKKQNLQSTSNPIKTDLGKITSNSRLDLQIFPNSLIGKHLNSKSGDVVRKPGPCSGNCSGRNWYVHYKYTINSFSDFQEKHEYTNIDEAMNSIEILVNNTKLDLAKLLKDNNAEIILDNNSFGQFLRVSIFNFHKLKVIEQGRDNIAYLSLKTLEKGKAAEGVRADSITGKNAGDLVFHAGGFTYGVAHDNKLKIAVSSWKFSEWQKHVHWNEVQPNKWKPVRGEYKDFYKGQLVDVVSTITNYAN